VSELLDKVLQLYYLSGKIKTMSDTCEHKPSQIEIVLGDLDLALNRIYGLNTRLRDFKNKMNGQEPISEHDLKEKDATNGLMEELRLKISDINSALDKQSVLVEKIEEL
jgi:hypothetical protein